MLTRLNKGLRFRSAIALAALYAFCILLPQAALAYSKNPAHCLTDTSPAHVHQASADAKPAHVHSDGSVHSHGAKASAAHDDAAAPGEAKHDGDGKRAGQCCGLFCISAMPHHLSAAVSGPLTFTHAAPALQDALVGCDPTRITRPPIG